MCKPQPASSIGGVGYSSPHTKTGSSSGGMFGLKKVVKSFTETVKGLRDWVSKAPSKPMKAFRIVVLAGMAVGAVLLGVAAVKVVPWVIAGGVLIGGGCLIYRYTRSNPA
ncbi:hypothetical protein [Endozoicomonas sp.]|uniref:hypothetical protein n=1 Tax=Endozoicomonas sp. TaxID=1892382 RepID=UPI0028849B5A|nr:hypothetical protein [Endozoicomonas sp.]